MISSQLFDKLVCSNCGKNIKKHDLNQVLECLYYHKEANLEK